MEETGATVRDVAELGPFLRSARQVGGLNQVTAARRLGVAQITISQWETGKQRPDVGRATAIAEVYGVDRDELLRMLAEQPAGVSSPRVAEASRAQIDPLAEQSEWLDAQMARHLAPVAHLAETIAHSVGVVATRTAVTAESVDNLRTSIDAVLGVLRDVLDRLDAVEAPRPVAPSKRTGGQARRSEPQRVG